MHYSDGTQIKLGDRIQFAGEPGRVVLSIDTNEYSVDFPESDWGYLKNGVMIETDRGALIHLENDSAYLITLVERSDALR